MVDRYKLTNNFSIIEDEIFKRILHSPMILANNNIGMNAYVIGNVTVRKNSIIGENNIVIQECTGKYSSYRKSSPNDKNNQLKK